MQAVDTLLRRACEKFTDATAITAGSESVSFSALLSRAQDVADELTAQGIGPGDVVGVQGRRSASVIVAVFGVWRAGAIVMLVDDALPQGRRETMLNCGPARATVDCAHGHRVTLRPAPEGVPVADLDDEDYAYVAFTSGSTGKPKAIIGSHTGLSQFLEWQSGEFGIGPHDRFAHLTNLSFDVWFRDALMPLISGATLCIPDQQHLDAAGVREFLQSKEITGFHLVPSLGKVWLSELAQSEPMPAVRLSFFAGEPLDGALVRSWQELFPACQVVNLYGPTETTLAQHSHRVPERPAAGIQQVGPNRPGSRSHILDEHGKPCADGASGEIHIAAEHPSHGYLVDGRLVSPFVEIDVDGQRVVAYPTGDLGRRAADGGLEILGRADDQIKIAGVRIELQEVRSAIQSHPSVRDVFVCAQEDRFTKVIVAVVEGDTGAERELRDYLGERLMSVMVPAAFLFKAELPKLPNGKVDRKVLAEAARHHIEERARRAADASTAGPRGGSVAERLERIWLSVAGGGASLADRESNFFDVGGTSLTIVVLHAEIQREFGVRFPLVRLFEHASFNAQRRFLESMANEPSGRVPGAATARGRAGRGRVLSARRTRQL
ncbi:non-ribosomal peptide synthetase [Streptomyces sp. NBC_01381]|uniref:non-ribosomal peptide synthetase n=1 Tax=Streptomyces sp. NBC_01381 TaxID=2903845 RepID=UPI00225042EA|nr:non-ribosomal peptide synthetase [Streptomyces sp. NBC_01381]MCX4671225.1 non-ribosomal peptide synthetase [Streptomyces sp. NBC_01381]